MATTAMAKTADKRVTLRRLFEGQRPELAKLLPRGMDADRLFRMALTEVVKNPKLLECTAESWALAVQTCAAQGLYPDSGLGYMYLIPRENKRKGITEVSALRGYQGDIALARKSGEIADIYAEVVYAKDAYRVVKGLARTIEHVPYDGDDDPGLLKAVYAVAKLTSGEVAWVALSRRDVDRHKRSAQGLDREDSPWRAHEGQMWRKTAIRELFRWLPKSSEAMDRLARDTEDPQPAETIDIAAIEVPIAEEEKAPLDALTEKLAETPKAETSAPADQAPIPPEQCKHPTCPPSRIAALAPGQSLACPCGEEWTAEAAARKPKQTRLEE